MSGMMDEEETILLATQLFVPVCNHLARMRGNGGVFETLNALAAVTATVLRGTGCDERAKYFFMQALRSNLHLDEGDIVMPMTDADRDALVMRASDSVMSLGGALTKEDKATYLEAAIVRLQSLLEELKAPPPVEAKAPDPAEPPPPPADETTEAKPKARR